MRGPRTVLGDRDAHTVQSAMTASIQSMRRSVNHRMEPASVRNCVGCGVAPIVDMAPSDLYRCSVTHDRFLWVCGACLNETKNEDADLFFFSRRNVSLFFFPSSLNKQRHMSWAPPKVMVTAGAPVSSGAWTRDRLTRLMQEDSTSTQATTAACVATIIASFFLLLLLRPPIVAWKRKENETPRLQMAAVVGWSVFAGVATLILVHTL